jgi:hypothetical protein
MNNIVDEILFVTDMDAAFSAATKCREEVFSGSPVVASTIVQIQRLAFPDLLIETIQLIRPKNKNILVNEESLERLLSTGKGIISSDPTMPLGIAIEYKGSQYNKR